MSVLQGLFTAPAWQSFARLAGGWALATDRPTLTTSVWLTGATAVQHFARCSVCLGGPLATHRGPLWGAGIRPAARGVPAGEVLQVVCDETTKKKAGQHSEGRARYRQGAGSARQASRTLRGVTFVLGIMRRPLQQWPGYSLSVPIGRAWYLKPAPATALNVPYRARRQLARASLDFVAEQVPGRPLRALAAGGYATQDYGQDRPAPTQVGGRCPSSAKLYELPPPPSQQRRGAPRKQGALLGSPHTRAKTATGWAPPPSDARAEGQAGSGVWPSGLPGQLLRGIVVRREAPRARHTPGRRKPLPAVEALFTTDLPVSIDAILRAYRARWAGDMAIRDAHACEGLGQAQCRKRHHIIGAHTFRVVLAAVRTLWFIDQVEHGTRGNLGAYRPGYRQKVAPSQLDVVWACRGALHEAGIVPIPRFTPALAENDQEPEYGLPLAA